jgi:hypothetical protein
MSSNTKAKRVLEEATKERRLRQYSEMKKWDVGKITGIECIENIIELEKIIFIGNKIHKPGTKMIRGPKK